MDSIIWQVEEERRKEAESLAAMQTAEASEEDSPGRGEEAAFLLLLDGDGPIQAAS